MLNDMRLNKDIVFDSTNLSRKRRLEFLDRIKDFNYKKICYVFITPISVCKERNSKRNGYSKITESEYRTMINMYNLPNSDEGWDNIILDIKDDKIIIKED